MRKKKSMSSRIRDFIKARPNATIEEFRSVFAPTTKSIENMFYLEHKKLNGYQPRMIKPIRMEITVYMWRHPNATIQEISEKFSVDKSFVYNTVNLWKRKGVILSYRKMPPFVKCATPDGEFVTVHKNTALDEEIWLYECGVVAV